MRAWITPRTVLIGLLLVAAPGAALAQLLLTWVPERVTVLHLNHEITADTTAFDAAVAEESRLQAELQQLQQALTNISTRAAWLAHRDRDLVFDRLATVFRDDHVEIELLTLAEPAFYCAVSRENLLACERATVRCAGDYAALAACLDRLARLDLGVRVRELNWLRNETGLTLALQLDVPFVPDEALAKTLADAAGLSEGAHEP